MSGIRKAWRESASLLILAKKPQSSQNTAGSKFNYDVLVQKRSTGSKFMANAIVFPGGVIEKADGRRNWLDLYRKLGVDLPRLEALKSTNSTDFIYQKNPEEELERELSLRISAIRETFEEVGILLAKSLDDFKDSNCLYSSAVPPSSSFDTRFWQKEVQDNPGRFYDLCESLKVAPDVLSLHSWSNWLTPTTVGKLRFDAIFYLTCLSERPSFERDQKEVQEILWTSPTEMIEANDREAVWLPPPQKYELSRLSHIDDIEKIAKFAKWRNQFGTTLIYPVQYLAKDKIMHVLPGDDLYPAAPNYLDKHSDMGKYEEKTAEEMRHETKNLHRSELDSLYKNYLKTNITPLDQHLCPLGEQNKVEDFMTQAKL